MSILVEANASRVANHQWSISQHHKVLSNQGVQPLPFLRSSAQQQTVHCTHTLTGSAVAMDPAEETVVEVCLLHAGVSIAVLPLQPQAWMGRLASISHGLRPFVRRDSSLPKPCAL